MNWRDIFENNKNWVAERTKSDATYFSRKAAKHEPQFLWIGCSDARVPANEITGTEAGQMFVHRNIANQVVPTDANLVAVVQYAVEALGVKDIIVCGHGECGGVKAALGPAVPAAVEQWITSVRMIARLHADELDAIGDPAKRVARLVELNVIEQVHNLTRLPVLQAAWAKGADLRVHGWVYDLSNGILRELPVMVDGKPAERGKEAAAPAARGARPDAGRQAAEAR